jgi:hypothetical protein
VYAGAPGPGQAPAKKGPNMGLIIGGILGGLLVVGGIIAAVVMFSGGGGALPVAHGNLPEKTLFVMRWDLTGGVADLVGMARDDVPEEALWTDLAEKACGGEDLYSKLMTAPFKWGRDRASKAVAQDPDEQKKALACGQEMAGELGSKGGVYWLRFGDDDDKKEVEMMALGVDELPETTKFFKTTTDPSNIGQTRCLRPWSSDGDGDCGDKARTLGKLDDSTVWVTGKLDDIKEFGSAYSTDGSNASSKLEALESLAKDMSAYQRVATGVAEGYHNRLTLTLGPGVSMYSEDESKELTEAVKEGGSVWALGHNGTADASEVKMIIVGKSESAAKDIKKKLNDFLTKLKEKINEKKDEKKDDDDKKKKDDKPVEEVKYKEAKQAMARRALKKAKAKLDGEKVILEITEEPKEGEKKAVEKYFEWRRKHSKYAVKIVQSLMEGKEPKEKDLKKLGGKKFVEMFKQQRALVKGDWPFDAVSWPALSSFKVPGGGKYESTAIGDKTIHIYKYPIGRKVLLKVSKKVLKDAGWKCDIKEGTDSPSADCTKGSAEVGVLWGEPDDGSTMVLFLRSE